MLIQTAHQHKSPDVTVHDTTKIIKRVLWSRSTSNLSIVVVFFQFGIVHSVCVCIRYLAVTVTCRLDRHLTTTVRRLRQRELGSVWHTLCVREAAADPGGERSAVAASPPPDLHLCRSHFLSHRVVYTACLQTNLGSLFTHMAKWLLSGDE